MQATTIIVKSGFKIAMIIVAIFVGFGATPANVSAASPVYPPNLLEGITLDQSLSPEDIAYLENTLQLLREQLPEWAHYVEESKPFALVVNTREGDIGREAVAHCCDAQGRGTITFGHPLGHSMDTPTPEGQQVVFIGTLIHELAHVRDQRAGRAGKTNFKSCVAVERSGLEKQLEVKRDWAAKMGGVGYRQVLGVQIESEASALRSRELWDLYCGAFEK